MRVGILAAAVTLMFTNSAYAEEVPDAPDASSMQSGAMFGFGMGLMTVGAAGMAAGAGAFASLSSCDDLRSMPSGDITRADLESCESEPYQKVGAIVGIATGGALLVVGLPLSIFGVTTRTHDVASEERKVTEPKVTATLGPMGGSLGLSF